MYPLPPNPRTLRPHVQVEAFCMMKYQSDAGEVEFIWNSRDGVTPFGVRLKSGSEARHVEWQRDQYLPNYVPEVGSRIFVDYTPLEARATADRQYDRWAEAHPEFVKDNPDREAFVTRQALSILEGFWPHSPHLIEVTEEIRVQFMRPLPPGASPRAG
jgi:hypothetical protein